MENEEVKTDKEEIALQSNNIKIADDVVAVIAGVAVLVLAVILVTNMPLIPKFKMEQDDSLNKMIFYAILTLAIIITFIYWGASYV